MKKKQLWRLNQSGIFHRIKQIEIMSLYIKSLKAMYRFLAFRTEKQKVSLIAEITLGCRLYILGNIFVVSRCNRQAMIAHRQNGLE